MVYKNGYAKRDTNVVDGYASRDTKRDVRRNSRRNARRNAR